MDRTLNLVNNFLQFLAIVLALSAGIGIWGISGLRRMRGELRRQLKAARAATDRLGRLEADATEHSRALAQMANTAFTEVGINIPSISEVEATFVGSHRGARSRGSVAGGAASQAR